MAVNKVVLGEDTLIDLTADTVSADKLSKGVTAHDMAGEPIVGTMEAGGGKEYTFTNGLTETNGTVSWDLNDKIKADNGVIIGYGSNGEMHSSFGSLSVGKYEQGQISNYGQGSIVFGKAGYNGKIGYDFLHESYHGDGQLVGGMSDKSTSHGYNCGSLYSYGDGSLAIGIGVRNKGVAGTVLGMCNITPSTGTYNTRGDYAFIYGNGTSDSARSNAYTLDWQGNGTFAGTVSSSTGADYAEYFEWKDGNPNNEDRVGYIVTLDGDKIVKANTGDDVLGICSGTAMVLGDSAEWNWSKRYLTDDFGRIIYEDYDVDYKEDNGEITKRHIHAPKQNPDYDASQPYVKRADRPEWQIVGMMGKLYVRDDGSCVVNGYADVKDGIATKASGKTNMRVMERVTDNIVRVLMK